MAKKSFIKGAAILGLAGILVKIIGAVYRIPLTNIIHLEGMYYYGIVYPVYSFLLVVSSAGLPTAISKMVSERVTMGDARGAHHVFKSAFRLLLGIGLLTTALMVIFSRQIATAAGDARGYVGYLAIAPALLVVSLISAYRGYFQGMQLMTPTAVSQVVEQVGKLAIGFTLASQMYANGPEYGAMGALIGVTASEIAALVLLYGVYRRKMQANKPLLKKESAQPQGSVMSKLLKVAIPVTIGASIMPLVSSIDSMTVVNRMVSIGFDAEVAKNALSSLSNAVNPLINMPAVLTLALMMSLVPAIAAHMQQKQYGEVQRVTGTALKIALLIGIPCAVGMYVLAPDILTLLYHFDEAELALSAELLRMMSVGVIFLSVVQTMTGVLQGMGKVYVPVINLLFGAILKVIISFTLIGMENINIMGAPLGTVICYATAAILNVIYALRKTKLKARWLDMLIKPAFAAVCMAASVWFLQGLLIKYVGSHTAATLLSIAAGIAVYASLILITRALSKDDLDFMPGGEKLEGVMRRAGLMPKK